VEKVFQLEQDEGTIVGHENLKNYITEYYKNLFGAQEPNYLSLVESQLMMFRNFRKKRIVFLFLTS
jgi:hypothetical protein